MSRFQGVRTLENFPRFLEEGVGGEALGRVPEEMGAPHTVVITASALRAVDVVRYVFSLSLRTDSLRWVG